jgi:Spy/CpxP family protein refolding chaperone
MKPENKQTIMIWAIVVLALMNVTTLVTIVYHQSQSTKLEVVQGENQKQMDSSMVRFSGRYFRDELNFNNTQMNRFREFNPAFRIHARSIILDLAEKRKQMLSVMSAKNSDTIKLNALSDSIGILHGQLKKITYSYYLDIKKICDDKQQQKLEQLFNEMFVSDTPLGFPGKGGMNGNGRQAGNPFKN